MFFFNKYWIGRLKLKLDKKGLKGLLISILNFINKNINPKHVGEFPFKYLFLKKRRLIKNFVKKELHALDDINIINIGNYLLNEKLINDNSIIYSFGVGESISFEESVSNRFNCKVFCYDPTSLAVNYMKNKEYDKNLIYFRDYGIWKEDKKIKFFHQSDNDLNNTGGSITNLFENNSFDLLQCYKLKTLMDQNNHKKIDILKMDIEGAAFEVLDNVINDKIYPKQIVVEFEYSEDDKIDLKKFKNWSDKLINLINVMKKLNYKCYYLPRYSHHPYSTIETLFIRKD